MDEYETDTRDLDELLETPERFRSELIDKKDEDISFGGYLSKLVKKSNLSSKELMQKAMISKTYYYQFLKNERLPGKNAALRLGFALELGVKKTNRLLKLAGKSPLYPKLRRDAAILYCLKKKMSLDAAHDFLIGEGEEGLM